MAVHGEAGHFIPYRRSEIVDVLAREVVGPDRADSFRSLARLLVALFHQEMLARLERMKEDFAPFDPDTDVLSVKERSREDREAGLHSLVKELTEVLVRANYVEVTEADLERALAEKALIDLDLRADFGEFEEMHLFRRGIGHQTVPVPRKLPFLRPKRQREVEVFERVVLLLRYHGAEHFRRQGRDIGKLPFRPGRLYVQLFRDIPRADLEFLFPNLRAGLSLRQKLFILVPAVGAGIPVLVKVVLTIGTLATALGIYLGLREGGDAEAMAGAAAGMTALAALGAYLFKQRAKYHDTLIRFQKRLTEQLFFRNIDSNSGVFRTVIDEAEEEEGKEAILAYAHLLAGGPAMAKELDSRIEAWFASRLGTTLDFDVEDALAKLRRLDLVESGEERLVAVPLAEALRRAHERWDDLFTAD